MESRFSRLAHDKRWRRGALLLSLWVPALIVLLAAREVLLPFLLAFTFAYVLAPIVKRISALPIRGRHLPRWAAVLVVYACLAGILWLAGAVFVPQLYREAARMAKEAGALVNQADEEHIDELSNKLADFFDKYNLPVRVVSPDDDVAPDAESTHQLTINLAEVIQDSVRQMKAAVATEAKALFGQVQTVVAGVFGVVFKTFLVLMLTAFIVADSERILDFLMSITPVRDRNKVGELLGRIDRGLSGVVRGQLTICLINGGLTLVGLLLLKVKFAFLLATLAAVFSLVPIFGSIMSSIPIAIVSLSTGFSTAFLMLLWIVGVHAVEANLLNPKIMGDATKIHPVLVVLALIIGERYYGIVGALLAVPLMSILATIFRAARQKAMELDEEIAAEPPSPPPSASRTTTWTEGARRRRSMVRIDYGG